MGEFSEMIPLYLTGDLSPADEDRLEAVLARSPALRRELVELGETLEALQRAEEVPGIDDLDPHSFFDERLAPRVAEASALRWSQVLLRAAALLIAFGAGVFLARDGSAAEADAGTGTSPSVRHGSPSHPPTGSGRTSFAQALEILRHTR